MLAIVDCVAQVPKLLYDWKMWKTQLKLSGVDCSSSVQEITAFYSILKTNRKQ